MEMQARFGELLPGSMPRLFGMLLVKGGVVMLMEAAKSDLRPLYGKLDEDALRYLMKQLMLRVYLLQLYGAKHSDIKLANIFVTEGGQVILGDLGCGEWFGVNEQCSKIWGTKHYMAPEVAVRFPDEEEEDDSSGLFSSEASSSLDEEEEGADEGEEEEDEEDINTGRCSGGAASQSVQEGEGMDDSGSGEAASDLMSSVPPGPFPITWRADIYSIGVVFEYLKCRQPLLSMEAERLLRRMKSEYPELRPTWEDADFQKWAGVRGDEVQMAHEGKWDDPPPSLIEAVKRLVGLFG